ncbi:MAG: spore coat U domain-containing protein [Xanthobacteraceae bacterium]|jgi:spore coat protein U-like protein
MFHLVPITVSRPSRKVVAGMLFLLPALNPSSTQAATTTSTFTVQMTVTSSCVINSASTLNFGNQGVLVANVDNTSTLQVQCTNTTPYNIGLDAGTGTGATVAARKMTNGANTITYSLYSDSGRTTVWGNTVGTNTVSATGTGASQSYTVYGRVPSQTTPAAATYTDTITVTVTY